MNVVKRQYYNVAVDILEGNIIKGLGDKTAIYYLDEKVSYNQVLAETNKLGNALLKLGMEMENRIVLLLLDCPEFVYSFLGAIKIGAVPIPTSTMLKSEDYLYVLNDSRAKLVIVSEELVPAIKEIQNQAKYLEEIIVVGKNNGNRSNQGSQVAYRELTAAADEILVPAKTCKDDPAFWLYSSGTTGHPKGTVHLHHDMIFAADTYGKEILKITSEDIAYSTAKLFFAYGLGNSLYFPFRVGASTVLCPQRPNPELVLKNVEKYRPTLFYGFPTSYAALLRTANEGEWHFNSVRMCISAGEVLPEGLFWRWKDRFNLEIIDGIGSTETLHIFISNKQGWAVSGSMGKLVPGYEAKIVGDDDLPVAPGEVGILHIKGDSIAAYYWNQHEKTKETFLGSWINTGDRFYQDDAGYFWYVGRGDDMIKVEGIWVSPVEVENTLLRHQAVLECGVIGKADSDKLIKPKAFVVLKDGYQATAELKDELKQFVKGQIAYYKYPRWIQFVAQLPKTAAGKIQRYKLRELEKGGEKREVS